MIDNMTKEDRLLKWISEHPDSKRAKEWSEVQEDLATHRRNLELEGDMRAVVRGGEVKVISAKRGRPRKERTISDTGKNKSTEDMERWSKIIEMRLDRKMSLNQIGQALTPPVTRERVRQIMKNISQHLGIEFHSDRIYAEKIDTKCKTCEKDIVVHASVFVAHGRHACSLHKRQKTKYKTKKEAYRAHYLKTKARYHADAEFRKRRLAHTMKYYHAHKYDPDRIAKQRHYQKTYAIRQRERLSLAGTLSIT